MRFGLLQVFAAVNRHLHPPSWMQRYKPQQSLIQLQMPSTRIMPAFPWGILDDAAYDENVLGSTYQLFSDGPASMDLF